MQRTPLLLATLLLSTVALAACGDETPAPADTAAGGVSTIVPAGKADDYFSTAGQEYTIKGKTFAVIDADCMAAHADGLDPEQTCKLQSIGLKNGSIAWFLNQYTLDKHEAANEKWGGFTAMTRPASYEALETSAPDADGRFDYTFTSELSGPLDLLDNLPTTSCDEGLCFTLDLPELDNATLAQVETGSEWYRRSPWSEYDPGTYNGVKETLQLSIATYPRSNDAFLEYNKLFNPEHLAHAGGKLQIGVFVGWDYNTERFDLQTAKEVYRWLTVDQGFKSPVGTFEDYTIDSPDLTRTIQVQGETIEVAARIVHPGQGDPATAAFAGKMKEEMAAAFSDRQIIIYEGHAGPLYGFALGNWRVTEAGELDDSELPFLDIPANFYQVVLASGCDTYMIADSLYTVPVKNGRVDMDIITTSSFSNAAGRGRATKALLGAVINQSDRGQLKPTTYGKLLRDLNRESWFTPIYGVHGIDDNPRANPFADPGVLCSPCSQHEDCGGADSRCTALGTETVCTTLCQTNADCAEGYTCFSVAEGNTIVDHQCAPVGLTCK